MNQPTPEEIFNGMRLKAPSAQYHSRAQAILHGHQPPHKAVSTARWTWGLAAALLLSLTLNWVQFRAQGVTTEPVLNQAEVSTSDAQKPVAGYSVVQSSESPSGLHQSITVIWENKS